MSFSRKHLRIIAVIPIGVALISSALYTIQGGFGGGAGPFDQIIAVLGLPWVLMPIPAPHHWPDFFHFIVLPLFLNTLLVSGLVAWFRRAKT